ncbi:response regulator transcription factor [Paracoccus contaminans]|uniref:DNA-binding response regulator n=1 Tax=Paracoccus contaminans TaxID=1945662 RepID=A0A1W6D1J2_9RHOB|nr:response regulator transcription factor [Paracoccus contaminans]ARJ70982.1 DNA-binding response regulator [Paracoccus contaminans]
MRILVVEDAPDVADAVARSGARLGWAVDCAPTLADGEAALATHDYDLAILDIELPDGTGTRLLADLRARRIALPIIMLTARSEVDSRIAALDAGADDYLTKPFDLGELAARVRSLTRRAQGSAEPVIDYGGLTLDPARRVALMRGAPLTLTRRELALLKILMGHRGWVLSKDRILERMFGFDDEVGINAVELYVTRLRRKIEGSGVSIRTLRGLGYQLVLDE